MIIAVDTETKGLDCTKFVAGCIVTERNSEAEVFTEKEDLWNRILELGYKARERGRGC